MIDLRNIEIKKIDFKSPEVIKSIESIKRKQRALMSLKAISQEDLNKEITI